MSRHFLVAPPRRKAQRGRCHMHLSSAPLRHYAQMKRRNVRTFLRLRCASAAPFSSARVGWDVETSALSVAFTHGTDEGDTARFHGVASERLSLTGKGSGGLSNRGLGCWREQMQQGEGCDLVPGGSAKAKGAAEALPCASFFLAAPPRRKVQRRRCHTHLSSAPLRHYAQMKRRNVRTFLRLRSRPPHQQAAPASRTAPTWLNTARRGRLACLERPLSALAVAPLLRRRSGD
jgi:hypothetical protein